MAYERDQAQIDLPRLTREIQRDLPAAPGGMNEQEFTQLCENIGRAIMLAVEAVETEVTAQEPEFGEEERAT